LQSFGRSREEQIIDRFLIGPGKIAKSRWQGERYEEVVFREQQFHLSFEPQIGALISTFGAVAILAGVVAVADIAALLAQKDVTAHRFRATVCDILHGLEVRGGHAISEFVTVFRAMAAKDVRQFGHWVSGRLKIVHEFVDGLEGRINGLGREMSVDGGGGWSAVAEIILDKP